MAKSISTAEWRKISSGYVKEKEWQKQVENVLRTHGFLVYHTLRSKGSAPGFPDIVAVRGDRLIFIELKTEKGELSKPQEKWLDALREAGVEVYVFRPSQFDELLEAAS